MTATSTATIARLWPPPTTLTSTLQLFCWTKEVEAAFTHLQSLLISAPILAHLDPNRQFIGDVDTSDIKGKQCSFAEGTENFPVPSSAEVGLRLR